MKMLILLLALAIAQDLTNSTDAISNATAPITSEDKPKEPPREIINSTSEMYYQTSNDLNPLDPPKYPGRKDHSNYTMDVMIRWNGFSSDLPNNTANWTMFGYFGSRI